VTAILIAVAVAFLFTLLGTPVAIRAFRAWGWGQRIREDGPRGHLEKMGTPTMGGVVMIGGVLAAYAAARIVVPRLTLAALSVLFTTVGLGVVGMADDLIKIRRRRSLGLNKRAKFAGQLLVALGFGFLALRYTQVSDQISFIRDTGLFLGWAFFAWVFLIITASANGVNLTDGLDGLAAGSTALVLAAYVIIAFWEFRHSCFLAVPGPACYELRALPTVDVAIVAAGGLGATTGFLWWNCAPAKIFMGDTGALALGGLVGSLAIMTDTQLLLLILGGLFVLEVTSVIVQVVSFRTTGRRVFRMAPLHHHFELLGWPETTVIVRFWILEGLCVGVGIGLFYADFLARGGGVG
jgi:phospho-N-acetylmuramoyl-pentapeptide-transferase